MEEVPTPTTSRDRLGSSESAESISNSENKTLAVSGSSNIDVKIDSLLKYMEEIKNETTSKKEIKIMIKEAVREEIEPIKQELGDLRRMMPGAAGGSIGEEQRSYSEAAKEKKKEELILYTNVRSLMKNKDKIHQIMKKNPALIALSETRLTTKIKDAEVNVSGYHMVRCDAETGYTGGVIIYIRHDIEYEEVLNGKLDSKCWCAAIKIKEKMYKGVIMVLYNSPKTKASDFREFLEDIVEKLIERRGECMVIGDFNINFKNDSINMKKLKTIMLNVGMKQYVNRSTRITKQTETMIDLVFANKEVEVQVDHESKIADHSWLKVELNGNRSENKYKKYSARDYKQFKIDDFRRFFINNLEQIRDLNISDRVAKFEDNMKHILDNTIPEKEFIKIPITWNKECDDTEQNWLQFKTEKNAVVELIKKKEYYENMIDLNKDNPSNIWKILKEMVRGEPIGNKETEAIDFEILDNVDGCNIADKFNLYYIQNINNIINSINRDKYRRTVEIENEEPDEFMKIDIEYLNENIMKLLKSYCASEKATKEQIKIISDVLQKMWNIINEEVVDIINTFLREGCCPETCKTSIIIPIPKIENAKKASEYRSIHELLIWQEVLELAVKRQIEIYLTDNDIITEHQLGFREQYSDEIQIVINEWKIIRKKRKMIGVIFMNLKRAFETIDREILLEKLYLYGIKGKVLKWLKSYLEGRKQQVRFNNKLSKLLDTKYGIPQGSVLGRLLFIIYINNIIEVCPEECSIKIFADNYILIYVTGESSEDLEEKMNMVFNKVEKWMNINQLKINTEKTKFMIVNYDSKVKGRTQEQIKDVIVKCLDGTEIEREKKKKFFGIIIDDKLQFKNHCNYILKKIGKKTSFLNRIGSFVVLFSDCTKRIIYKSIISPHFKYCETLLIDNPEQLSELRKAQNRAMRAILQCDRSTENMQRTEYMLKELQSVE
ncbi:PREDICTED: uncharacterized protein LOC105453325 [Wasmannia auropunctata]|uniref:uncharacterized protein LOC105453325 n=1 Tax=Wasmannia auropunctata TaxID=64793 RepID=UPI0005EE19DC|nr:PREDICTED: uncharacterized protein LOC105453325 [Wasmannia auropunctata]XP_011693470.1 PREDICTED: uncharacterized protein LOC105453325 [Wasmannia auropunctata]